jgi:hypothetical protein
VRVKRHWKEEPGKYRESKREWKGEDNFSDIALWRSSFDEGFEENVFFAMADWFLRGHLLFFVRRVSRI